MDHAGIFLERMALGADGLSVAVKDSIDIAGFATRMASGCLADAPPAARHAAVVESLLEAGCRIVGKTNMHELAYGLTGINGWAGTPINPHAPGRVPGGSSSGSAVAVAADLVDFALGNDTGGSIRLPAACCGVCGFKPSYGRVSRAGVHPQRSTLDCVGPLAREVSMIERAMTMIDPTFRPRSAPAHPRIGWVEVEVNPAVAAAARAALERSGVRLRPVALPSFAAAFQAGSHRRRDVGRVRPPRRLRPVGRGRARAADRRARDFRRRSRSSRSGTPHVSRRDRRRVDGIRRACPADSAGSAADSRGSL